MKRVFLCLAVALLIVTFPVWCRAAPLNGITQVATFDALLAGVYDGHMSLEDLKKYGDFGIGTFEAMDGEMIFLDGDFYKVRADGKVYRPDLSERTPFACVTAFNPDHAEDLTAPMDFAALEREIDHIVPEPNRFCAFRVRGTFPYVKTRSIRIQQKPYPPLVEVTRDQPVFVFSEVEGVLIGFRSPSFVKGVNVAGYHMHFLADDLSGGGHLLEFQMSEGTLELDTRHEWFSIYLPEDSAAFAGVDLAKDRSEEAQAVEKDRRTGDSTPAEAGKEE